ncbi:MAG: hypothetical protein RLZZ08_313 [Pseudomonadota bacterium]|jgi:leucyl/phenylalanyl-tRNA--protein transferase
MHDIIAPELLLAAYRSGIFPMSDSRDDEDVYWVEPRERAIIPLPPFRPAKSLAKVIRQDRFRVTCNADFAAVVAACAAPRVDHPETWISARIDASYRLLHELGHAHSVECWLDGQLVGGLYGVAFDRVFCGESMFSRATDASKVALVWLVALLRHAGFTLLDCQFMTDHLASMGAVAISRDGYQQLLQEATGAPARMTLPEAYVSLAGAAAGVEADGLASGEAVAEGDAAGRRGAAPSAPSPIGPRSSPGKLILQSLTQTS